MTGHDDSPALQERVRQAIADRAPVEIRGSGSLSFHGCPQRPARRIETLRHRGAIRHQPSELIVTVRAGTPIAELRRQLMDTHQMLAFDPPAFGPDSTIGGVTAAGLAGPRRPWGGAVRDNLLGVRLINGRGQILSFGGEVMKNVAGYDVSRLMAGAMGTLGLLLDLSFKLRPLPESEQTLVQETRLDEALVRMRDWRNLPANCTGLAWVDGRLYLRLSGEAEAVAVAARRVGGEPLAEADAFWSALRDQRLDWFDDPRPLWRISLKPAAPQPPLDGDWLIEWNATRRWLKTDLPAATVRQAIADGHATLFRAGNETTAERFPPLPAPLMQLHRAVKRAMDPDGLFNPGRLYPDL